MKSDQQLKDFYNGEYVDRFSRRHESDDRLVALTRLIKVGESGSVVDLACGNGLLMDALSPRVKSYTGVDFSQAFIDAADERKTALGITNANFVCADIEQYCSAHARTYDAAFALDFSEHVLDEDWLRMLASIRTCLKSRGTLYLHTPNADFIIEKMKANNFILKQFPEHIAVRNIAENAALLERAGFELVAVRSIAHYYNSLRWLHSLSYIPIVGKYFEARVFIEAAAPA